MCLVLLALWLDAGAQPPDAGTTEVGALALPALAPHPVRVEGVRWSGAHAQGFGLAVGLALHPPTGAGPGAATEGWRPTPAVGLRWRSVLNERRRLDVAAWRNLPGADRSEPALDTRVELQFRPAGGDALWSEFGAVGLQLSSEARLQLKLRRGGPVLYYRSRF